MNALDDFGSLDGGQTLTLQRLLPGPIERVWTYLVDGNLRGTWLASGALEPTVGGALELIWRNDSLTDPPGAIPDGMGGEHRLQTTVTVYDPPHRLAFAWGASMVTIDLAPAGDRVLLTLTHTNIIERWSLLMTSAGWHAHLDVLGMRLANVTPVSFWDQWTSLRDQYDERFPA